MRHNWKLILFLEFRRIWSHKSLAISRDNKNSELKAHHLEHLSVGADGSDHGAASSMTNCAGAESRVSCETFVPQEQWGWGWQLTLAGSQPSQWGCGHHTHSGQQRSRTAPGTCATGLKAPRARQPLNSLSILFLKAKDVFLQYKGSSECSRKETDFRVTYLGVTLQVCIVLTSYLASELPSTLLPPSLVVKSRHCSLLCRGHQ